MNTHEMVKDFARKMAKRAHDAGWAADSVKVTVEIGDWKAEVESTYVEIGQEVFGT
jgi:hypothetical protein